MSVWIVFHSLVVWPVRAAVEGLFVLFQAVFNDEPGLSILFIGLLVNSALLPIYAVADRWQREEREIRERMRKKLADIRAVFRGDERQMMVNAYHRQMGYTPVKALKSSAGLLLQVPFFIGAYEFLSRTSSLRGASFLFLSDLGAPDALLGFNLLPLVMTAANILASLVYTRAAPRRERLQLFVMAGLFLVLLYDSPSGLVLYWTVNNLFSLAKNLAVAHLKRPVLALRWAASLASLAVAAALLSGVASLKPLYRYTLAAFCLAVPAVPFLWARMVRFTDRRTTTLALDRGLYFGSWSVLCALTGLLAPAQVLASSPTEFDEPWAFVIRTALQGISACMLVPAFLWAFTDTRRKRMLSVLSAFIALLALASYFILSGNYGTMTRGFSFENPHRLVAAFPLWTNAAAAAGAAGLCALFLLLKKKRLLVTLLGAASAAIALSAAVELYAAGREPAEASRSGGAPRHGQEALFHFSRTEDNTFVLFLDRAIGVAFGHALELLPETAAEFEGFVWYPRTISFGDCTILGVPTILGGYEYAPWNMNARTGTPLADKINESLALLPRLYGEAGRRVSITDPSLAGLKWIPDTSIFDGLPRVSARNIKGLYAKRFLEEQGYPSEPPTEAFDYDILFRYSLFRALPPALRYTAYYNGLWWRDGRSNSFDRSLAVFPNLYYLKDLCAADGGPAALNIFMNESTHEYGAFTTDFLPSREPVRYGEAALGRFGSQGDAGYAYAFLASMRAVGSWLRYLKEEGVYDNTLIVVVADHGGRFRNDLFEIPSLERFNPLLLVKERRSRGELRISEEFMTIADVPALLTASDGVGSTNPYTGGALDRSAAGGPLRIYEAPGSQNRHGPTGLSLRSSRTYLGGDIYRAASWGEEER